MAQMPTLLLERPNGVSSWSAVTDAKSVDDSDVIVVVVVVVCCLCDKSCVCQEETRLSENVVVVV